LNFFFNYLFLAAGLTFFHLSLTNMPDHGSKAGRDKSDGSAGFGYLSAKAFSMSYNKEEISAKFERGKYLLDRAYYYEAIVIFTELIDVTDPLKDTDEDSLLTWNVSLNNRGVAKCKSAYSSGNKALFEDGLNDYRTTVNHEKDEVHRERMTASGNLRFGEKQLEDFDKKNTANFRFEWL
jgi:hypothetical protein